MPSPDRANRFVWHDGDLVITPPDAAAPPRGPRGIDRDRATPYLATALGELRRARNLTQTQLAERLGVDQAQISRLERRGDPQLSTIIGYLQGLGALSAKMSIEFEDGTAVQVPLAHAAHKTS